MSGHPKTCVAGSLFINMDFEPSLGDGANLDATFAGAGYPRWCGLERCTGEMAAEMRVSGRWAKTACRISQNREDSIPQKARRIQDCHCRPHVRDGIDMRQTELNGYCGSRRVWTSGGSTRHTTPFTE